MFVEEGRVRTHQEVMRRRFSKLPPMRFAVEAGTHSPWVSRLLKEVGHEVFVANPGKLRLIFENPTKSDKVDSRYLARVAALDPGLLSPIQHRGAAAQADLARLRSRDALVRVRTQLINHVRGIVKSHGERLPSCSSKSFADKVTPLLPEPLREGLLPVLETLRSVNAQIQVLDSQIEAIAAERYPECAVLTQVPGVATLTALAFVLTLEDPLRLKNSRAAGAFLGLVPKRRGSGNSDPQLRITKRGDPYCRRLLVGSAHYILGPFGPDCDLQRYGLRIAERGGANAKKRAAVAVARKLAVLLHHLWRTGSDYQPLLEAA
jgi:transposase